MSIEGQNLKIVSCLAGTAILENTCVKLNTSDTAAPGDLYVDQGGDGEACCGVACEAATAKGQVIGVCVEGYGKLVIAGAAPDNIAVGSQVACDAAGKVDKVTAALGNSIGIAIGATNTAGALVPIIVQPFSSVKAAS